MSLLKKFNFHNIRLDRLLIDEGVVSDVPLHILRLDLLHRYYGGNKLLKLWPIIERQASLLEAYPNGIVSMGGAHSNHLYALCALCNEYDIPVTVIVRKPFSTRKSYILYKIDSLRVKVHFVDSTQFRAWRENGKHLADRYFPGCFWVHEGGTEWKANPAFKYLVDHWLQQGLGPGDTIVIPTGTGGTAVGILELLPKHIKGVLINCVPGYPLEKILRDKLPKYALQREVTVISSSDIGKFGKVPNELHDFAYQWQLKHGIPIDPIYHARALKLLISTVMKETDNSSTNFHYLHTGGHAGRKSWEMANGITFTPPEILPDSEWF